MPIVPIRIPQLGEGLAEALLVEYLKQPGDVVKRDDPLYTMETDKANSDVESPYDGTIVEWTVEPGSVLAIGAEVGKMEVAQGVKEVGGGHGPSAPEAGAAPATDKPAATAPPAPSGDGTKLTAIRIPQLGEGLAEAMLVEYLKQPGDAVKRDDPLYTMETDKANSDVESPFDGTIVEWLAEPGAVLPIGAQVGTIRVAADAPDMAAGHGPAPVTASKTTAVAASTPAGDPEVRILMPPRTRKLLRDRGLLDQAGQIPAAGRTLMPADVERYLAGDKAPAPTPAEREDYDEAPLPVQQQTLNYRLVRGAQVCVPVTCMTDADWSRLDEARAAVKAAHDGKGGPTAFLMMLWCVTQVLKEHPRFRSALVGDGKTLRTYKHVNLGIAVALPGDLMVTAVVKDADTYAPDAFFQKAAEQIALARDGKDQADASTTLSVSNMGTAGMEMGIPAIVAPAVATLVLGKTYWQPVPDGRGGYDFIKTAKLALTFDHRVANGVGAGRFLADVKQAIEAFSLDTVSA